MKHKDIIHRIMVDKEMMIKGIADLLYWDKAVTKKVIRDHISWLTWYNGSGSMEDQMDEVRALYPTATTIYNKLYKE